MTAVPFIKMQGAGNDFIVIDNRTAKHRVTTQWATRLSDRHFGIGCDQLIVLEASKSASIFMRIYNADGSEVDACGNASRCVAWLAMKESGKMDVAVETQAGVLQCHKHSDFSVRVDMGEPRLSWDEIPLSEPRNTEHLGIAEGTLMDPVAVNMGNPHMVFFVKDLSFIRLDEWGAKLERHPLYPKRANVSAAQILTRDAVKLNVWERGTGLTMACGTAACATLVAGVMRDLLDRRASITLPGGELLIEWSRDNNHVFMTGPVATEFEGQFDMGLVL